MKFPRRIAPLTRQLPDIDTLKGYLHLAVPGTDPRANRLKKAADIWDLRRIARRRTPTGPFEYVGGAAERELSLARSRTAYEELSFRPGVLRDVEDITLATTVMGSELSMPLAIAPTGFTRMMHAEGEVGGSRAAAKAGIAFTLSTMGTATIEEVQQAAPDGAHWFQLYLTKAEGRGLSEDLMRRAKEAGFTALMVTIDCPVTGARHRDTRNGMTFPPQLTWKTFLDASYRPEWWLNFLSTEPLGFANVGGGLKSFSEIGKLFDRTLNFEDLAWLRRNWDGPLLVKGIQTTEDAVRCMAEGMDGVVLSNHGGRQLDRAPVPLYTLPQTREALGEDATILLDTGVMSGADVVAACALGADAVLIGRAYLYGLMAAGAEGVSHALGIFRNEMERALALMGVDSIHALTPEHVDLDWRTAAREYERTRR